MRNLKLEKAIKKVDKEIEALKIASKYLSNLDEINDLKDTLNKKRQVLADEIYIEDGISYRECCEVIQDLLNKELGKVEQKELLEKIKEVYGRQSPNASRDSNGLNAWLKHLDIEVNWIEYVEEDWAGLVITGFGLHQ